MSRHGPLHDMKPCDLLVTKLHFITIFLMINISRHEYIRSQVQLRNEKKKLFSNHLKPIFLPLFNSTIQIIDIFKTQRCQLLHCSHAAPTEKAVK